MPAEADGRSGRRVHVMKFKKSLAGAVLVLALSGGGFAAMAAASTSAPGKTPLGKIGASVDGPPPAGVTVTPGEPADPAR